MRKSDGNSSSKRRNIDWGAPVAVLIAAGLLIAYELLNDLILVAIAAVIAVALRIEAKNVDGADRHTADDRRFGRIPFSCGLAEIVRAG